MLRHRAGRNDHDGGAAKRGHTGNPGQVAARARNLDHVARRRREGQAARYVERPNPIARREHAAIDEDVIDGAGAAERPAGTDDDETVDHAVDRERAAKDIPVLRAGADNRPVRAVDLVEGRRSHHIAGRRRSG